DFRREPKFPASRRHQRQIRAQARPKGYIYLRPRTQQSRARDIGHTGMDDRMQPITDNLMPRAGCLPHQGFTLNDFGIRLAHPAKSKARTPKSKVERITTAKEERKLLTARRN